MIAHLPGRESRPFVLAANNPARNLSSRHYPSGRKNLSLSSLYKCGRNPSRNKSCDRQRPLFPCEMATADTMNVELACSRIACQFQELLNLFFLRIFRIAHPDVDVLHSGSFSGGFFITGRVVAQVNDSLIPSAARSLKSDSFGCAPR